MNWNKAVIYLGMTNVVLNLIMAGIQVIQGESPDLSIIKMVVWMILVEVKTDE